MLAVSGGFLTARYGDALPLPEVALAVVVGVSLVLSRFQVDIGRDGVVYLSRRSPVLTGTGDVRELVDVRETGDGRGRGAFAATALRKGLRLGVYEGELIDNARYVCAFALGKEEEEKEKEGIRTRRLTFLVLFFF